MTENMLARAWRLLWNPPPPKCVKRAMEAQAEAASSLVRKIENNSRRGLSLSIERDLSHNDRRHAD